MVSSHTVLSLHSALRIKEDHVIQHGLVVDGASLSLALREHEKLFMEVCKNCSAVLCCRMAPLQKAKVSSTSFLKVYLSDNMSSAAMARGMFKN